MEVYIPIQDFGVFGHGPWGHRGGRGCGGFGQFGGPFARRGGCGPRRGGSRPMIPGNMRFSLDDMDMDNWISPAEVFGALFARPEPRTPASTPAETSEQATAVASKNAFEVKLNVTDYKPETLNVTVSNGVITVEGKHEETKTEKDEQGNEVISEEFVSRRFKRMYKLPANAIDEQLECKFTADGHLLLSAPLKAIEAAPEQPAVRSIPISRNAEVEGEAPVATAPAENGEPMSNESTEPEPAPMDSEKTN